MQFKTLFETNQDTLKALSCQRNVNKLVDEAELSSYQINSIINRLEKAAKTKAEQEQKFLKMFQAKRTIKSMFPGLSDIDLARLLRKVTNG
nr:hypothetical protein [Vibrio breoganii]PMK30639.1 hypothetical protein BCU03_09485 [Vibrio breoganii]